MLLCSVLSSRAAVLEAVYVKVFTSRKAVQQQQWWLAVLLLQPS